MTLMTVISMFKIVLTPMEAITVNAKRAMKKLMESAQVRTYMITTHVYTQGSRVHTGLILCTL